MNQRVLTESVPARDLAQVDAAGTGLAKQPEGDPFSFRLEELRSLSRLRPFRRIEKDIWLAGCTPNVYT